jgi:hypothetical protein
MADKIWVGTTGDLSTAGNWSPSGVPAAGDNVYVPAGSGAMSSNMDALKTATLGGALGTVEVEAGYTGAIGSKSAYWQFTPTAFRFSGTGAAYINIEAAAISPDIRATASAATASAVGLYLRGSAIATLSIVGSSSVGVAFFGGETSTITTARVVGPSATLVLGSGVTITTCQVLAGQSRLACAVTTLDIQGGIVTTLGSGAITTCTVDAGVGYLNSSGTITTANINGGTVDMLGGGAARTITTANHNGGVLRYDENVVTITTYNRKDGPSQIVVSDP